MRPPGLEAGAPGGAARPMSQGHPRTGAPRRYPVADDPPRDLPAGSRPARKNRSGQRGADAFRRRGRADLRLKRRRGAGRRRTDAPRATRGPRWRGRAAGFRGSRGLGGRCAADWAGSGGRAPSAPGGASGAGRGCTPGGKQGAGQGSRAAGLSLHSAADRGLARWVQWFLTVQQFCSAIVKCLGPLDPAGLAAAATATPPPTGALRAAPARRSPGPRSAHPAPPKPLELRRRTPGPNRGPGAARTWPGVAAPAAGNHRERAGGPAHALGALPAWRRRRPSAPRGPHPSRNAAEFPAGTCWWAPRGEGAPLVVGFLEVAAWPPRRFQARS